VRRYLPIALLLAGSILLAAGAVNYIHPRPQGPLSRVAAVVPDPRPIITPPGPLPAPVGVAPAPTASPAQLPGGRVRVPQLGIDLEVIEGDGFNAPLGRAAHYPGMKWPGEGGRSLLYAHARPGMFGPLLSAAVGQRIEFTRPDGTVLRYTVREYYPRWPINDLKWLLPGDHEQLVLLTCTTYNYSDPRVVVVAEPA